MPNVYEIVTEQITEALATGDVPWQRGYSLARPANLLRQDRPYRGVNVLLASISARAQGFGSPYWLTFKQAKQLGAHVAKGSKSTVLVWASRVQFKEKDDDTGEEVTRSRFVLKYYRVFNVEQVEGLPAGKVPAVDARQVVEDLPAAQSLADSYLATPGAPTLAHNDGLGAWYSPMDDSVSVPHRELYEVDSRYWSTLYHELTHSTGHTSRLARKGVAGEVLTHSDYGYEELVADIGAAMLSATVGIEPEYERHAAYCRHWMETLSGHPRWIVSAAAQAEKAANYVQGIEQAEDRQGVDAA